MSKFTDLKLFNSAVIVEQKEYNGSVITIYELDRLKGAVNYETAQRLYFLDEAKVRLRFIHVDVKDEAPLQVEAGALYFKYGNMLSSVEEIKLNNVISRSLMNESLVRTKYAGKGEVFLQPSFNHFKLLKLSNNASVICNKGTYYASIGNIRLSPVTAGNSITNALGGDGVVQTQISGNGVVILKVPAPADEILTLKLDNMLEVDGNFLILRESSITMEVVAPHRGLNNILSGEGVLNRYKGKGTVWLAPTATIYNELLWKNVSDISNVKTGNYIKGK